MSKNIIFMFSGQGSQYYHMGNELYNDDLMFRESMNEIDLVVHDLLGYSIIGEIYNTNKKKSENFDRLLYTHIAIYMVEFSLAKSLIYKGVEPEYVIGTSLGEFVAATIAGVIDKETAIECVLEQAKLVEENCTKGGMLAILHDPQIYYNEKLIMDNSTIASINFKNHFVVSGSCENLNLIEKFLKEKKIINQKLPVQYAFHSKEMTKIKDSYLKFLGTKNFKKPNVKLISSLYGKVTNAIPNNYFYDLIEFPIKFTDIVSKIYNDEKCILMDLGPSGTLSNFIKYNNEIESSSILSIITPFGNNLKKSLDILKIENSI